jgi:hypothetical protein
MGGFYALFVTYSSDLAFGIPIVGALFPTQLGYLYILAAAQVLSD